MRKFKLSSIVLLSTVALGAVACGGNGGNTGKGGGGGGGGNTTSGSGSSYTGEISFYHNFGGGYSGILEETLTSPLKANEKINVVPDSKGSYEGLYGFIRDSIATKQYPKMATGYPDHFAFYSRVGYPKQQTGILLSLDDLLANSDAAKEFKTKYGYDLINDYYPEYLKENQEISYDENDKGITIGLPFNKSTEVMGYNGVFYDFVVENVAKYGEVKIPETWAEWATYGPRFRQAQMDLIGKYLKGTMGTPSTYEIVAEKPSSTELLLDCSELKYDNSAVFSWDSGANMFITLVRQFGGTYTRYTETDRKQKQQSKQHGYAEWWYTAENKAATKSAMEMVLGLTTGTEATPAADASDEVKRPFYAKRIFTTPAGLGGLYSSNAFRKNQVMFTICSTGGLSYNVNPNQDFRIAPIPYKDASNKQVISQGANITLFKQDAESIDTAFKAIVKMTTGEYQGAFAAKTGYFPATKSATNSEVYQAFLKSTDTSDANAVAFRRGAQVNEEEYMAEAKGWTKFVDPGFEGSSNIRTAADGYINTLLTAQKTEGFVLETKLDEFWTKSDLDGYRRS